MSFGSRAQVPEVLYKYRDFSDRERVRQIILSNKVWFSSPADFNDPFDCKVHTSFTGSKKDWEEHMTELLKKHRPQLNRRQRRAETDRIFILEKRHKDPEVFLNVLREAQQAFNTWGVFCLSARNDDLLMWSYYAGGHRGLCLGFASRHIGPLGPAFPVEYSAKFPHVDYLRDGHLQQWRSNFLTKAAAWSHESEWRVVDSKYGRGARSFPPELLVEIILGAQMAAEDRAEVISWIEKRPYKPSLFEARVKGGEYGVELHLLDPGMAKRGAA